MADLTKLTDQAAEEILKAIRDQARKASGVTLLQLAQAYSVVVSTAAPGAWTPGTVPGDIGPVGASAQAGDSDDIGGKGAI